MGKIFAGIFLGLLLVVLFPGFSLVFLFVTGLHFLPSSESNQASRARAKLFLKSDMRPLYFNTPTVAVFFVSYV